MEIVETITIVSLMRKLNLSEDLLELVKRLDAYSIRLSIYTAVALHEKFNLIVEMNRRQLEKIPCTHNKTVSCLKCARMILINELDSRGASE